MFPTAIAKATDDLCVAPAEFRTLAKIRTHSFEVCTSYTYNEKKTGPIVVPKKCISCTRI